MHIKAIIIDDEASARQTLANLIKDYTRDVEVIAEASSVETGLKILQINKPDIVFLDVRMHPGTGFNLLERIPEINFEIIFTTAYDRYALKAIKFSALDYLLKPINPAELNTAIEKVKKRKESKPIGELSAPGLNVFRENIGGHFNKITLPTAHGLMVIELKNIIRCEGDRNYTVFHLVRMDSFGANQQKVVTSRTLKEYEEMLDGHGFLRIQKSHLVNLSHVKKYNSGRGGQVEMADGSLVQVSRDRKKELLEKLRTLL